MQKRKLIALAAVAGMLAMILDSRIALRNAGPQLLHHASIRWAVSLETVPCR